MNAYYFAEARWALDDIRRRRVKVSLLSDLNDPFELLALDLTDPVHRPAFLDAVNYCRARYGVLCLSRSCSNPLLWGHYGDRHRGICLGFDINDDLLMPIDYQPDRLRPDIEQAAQAGDMQPVVHRVFSTKSRDWAYEAEVRAWITLDERDDETGLYFADFGAHLRLREVVRGLRCEVTPAEIDEAISGLDGVKVWDAQLSLGTFSIEKADRLPAQPNHRLQPTAAARS
jgi:hypothetical protein